MIVGSFAKADVVERVVRHRHVAVIGMHGLIGILPEEIQEWLGRRPQAGGRESAWRALPHEKSDRGLKCPRFKGTCADRKHASWGYVGYAFQVLPAQENHHLNPFPATPMH